MLRAWKIVGAALIAIGVAVALIIIVGQSAIQPPLLRLTSKEPAGIMDDHGVEMWLVILVISNSDTRMPLPRNGLYVDGASIKPVQARVKNDWAQVGRLGLCGLPPGGKREVLLVVPGDAECCEVSCKYTYAVLSSRGRLAWLAENLPQSVRAKLSYKFWRWVGFTYYRPSSHWWTMSVKLPLD